MRFIVSANYRDRSSEYRCLVRQEGEDPEAAVACKAVELNGNVTFENSTGTEEGFGCRVVAYADAAEMFYVEENRTVLEFDGYKHFEGPDGEYVRHCKALSLTEDGEILAVL